MRSLMVVALFLSCLPTWGSAGAPDTSIRPLERPAVRIIKEEVTSVRPVIRPRIISQTRQRQRQGLGATVTQVASRIARGSQGSVCGDSTIKGTKISPIPGRIRGCGVRNPVKLTEIDGVGLTQPATIDCNTARALKAWVKDGVKPAVGRRGGGVKSLRVAAHYTCRTRNNRTGAKISEHGKGRAIDISGILLNDGSEITVLKGWRTQREGRMLRKMHKAACGPFGTVLGPDSDRFHQDHFHFDTAQYRSGSYCR